MITTLLHCLKVLDSELKAYSGIVKDLGKEAEKLKKSDPANAKEIAAEQVCYGCILLCVLTGNTDWVHLFPRLLNTFLIYANLICECYKYIFFTTCI